MRGAITIGTMNRHMMIWDTRDMPALKLSDEYLAAAREYVAAVRALERARLKLAPLVAAEVARGAKLSHVAKAADYTPAHVRRIARAFGVEGDSSIVPPPPPPRKRKVADEPADS